MRLASPHSLPSDIPIAPAPWKLRAQGYVMLLKLPLPRGRAELFASSELADARFGPYAWAMFVDYADSPVGPYRELLLIPSRFRFGTRRLPSITKIYVSSPASVYNGRRNWGIPKELASFEVTREAGRIERVSMRVDGRPAVELAFQHALASAPVASWLLPKGLRTLGQTLDRRTFTVAPHGYGLMQRARVLSAWSDGELFAELAPERVMAAVRLSKVSLTFPEAKLL